MLGHHLARRRSLKAPASLEMGERALALGGKFISYWPVG